MLQILQHLQGPYWTLFIMSLSLSCLGEGKDDHSGPACNTLPYADKNMFHPFIFRQGILLAHIQLHQDPQDPSYQAAFLMDGPQHLYLCMELLLPRYRSFYFPLVNFMRFLTAHFSNLLKSFCMAAQFTGVSATPPSFVSSANFLGLHPAPPAVIKDVKN